MEFLKEIVIVGSGFQHLDSNIIDRFISNRYITIGPAYNYIECEPFNYYFWTGTTFKDCILERGVIIKPPKVKSLLNECSPGLIDKFTTYYPDEFRRLKCEICNVWPWKFVNVKKCSSGLRTFYYVLYQFPYIERIIFLGCSALAGDVEVINYAHDFSLECETIRLVLEKNHTDSVWIHEGGIY